jgi:hypothetical protein
MEKNVNFVLLAGVMATVFHQDWGSVDAAAAPPRCSSGALLAAPLVPPPQLLPHRHLSSIATAADVVENVEGRFAGGYHSPHYRRQHDSLKVGAERGDKVRSRDPARPSEELAL